MSSAHDVDQGQGVDDRPEEANQEDEVFECVAAQEESETAQKIRVSSMWKKS